MAYNNRNNNYNSGGNNRGNSGNWNNNNSGWNNCGNNAGGPPKKRSGCTRGLTREQKPYVRGWKYDKTHGLRAFIAGPNVKTHLVKSKSGASWENWTVKVTSPNGIMLHNCIYSPETHRVFIKDLGIVMSPKSDYTGPFFRRKK